MALVSEFMAAVNQICSERGIDPEEVFIALELAVLAAYKKDYGGGDSVKAEIDRATGEIHIIADKEVVKRVIDKETQISLEDARKLESNLQEEDHVEIEMPVDGFGRIAAQTAKQVVLQKVRESEKDAVIQEFTERVGTVVTGLVQRMMGPTAVVEIGKAVAQMPPEEQIPNEFYKIGERYKFLLKEIRNDQDLIVSRGDPAFLKEIFKLEVPEIESEIVEIKACAREAGSRSKLAVISHQDGVDPIGSCVGQKGIRIANVMSELGDEKIDIIEWDENFEQFVANALGPAQVENVEVDDGLAKVKVQDDQLSLAIGKDGQNVRLAAKLTEVKIDITSPSLESQNKADVKKDGDDTEDKGKLSSRVLNALKKAEISVDELTGMVEKDISEIKGIGKASLDEIMVFINKASKTGDEKVDKKKDKKKKSTKVKSAKVKSTKTKSTKTKSNKTKSAKAKSTKTKSNKTKSAKTEKEEKKSPKEKSGKKDVKKGKK